MTTWCSAEVVKVKKSRRPREGVEAYFYSSFNLGVIWGGWSPPSSGRFTPRKETRYPLYRRLDGPQGRSGRVRKMSPPPGFDPRTVQSVASRYTDCGDKILSNSFIGMAACQGKSICLCMLQHEIVAEWTHNFARRKWSRQSLFRSVRRNWMQYVLCNNKYGSRLL